MGFFTPEYCCCAIPLVNAGIYTLLTEQLVVGVLAGVLALATPNIVGSSVPSFTPYIFAALCFIVAAIQCLGFMGVFREKTSVFRTYSILNAVGASSVFVISAVLIIISALHHNDAVTACEIAYFSVATSGTSNTNTTTSATSSATSGEGKSLCEAFAWADVGIMGGLWLMLLVMQGYFVFITTSYSKEQKEDHQRYKSIYSTNAEEFAMAERNSRFNAEAWEGRPSVDGIDGDAEYYPPSTYPLRDSVAYGPPGSQFSQHDRSESNSSIPTYDYPPNPYAQQPPYGGNPFNESGHHYADEAMSGGGGMGYPEQAVRGRDPGSTPTLGSYNDGMGYADGGLRRPEEGKMHPGR